MVVFQLWTLNELHAQVWRSRSSQIVGFLLLAWLRACILKRTLWIRDKEEAHSHHPCWTINSVSGSFTPRLSFDKNVNVMQSSISSPFVCRCCWRKWVWSLPSHTSPVVTAVRLNVRNWTCCHTEAMETSVGADSRFPLVSKLGFVAVDADNCFTRLKGSWSRKMQR